jgi:hypothetical protein
MEVKRAGTNVVADPVATPSVIGRREAADFF